MSRSLAAAAEQETPGYMQTAGASAGGPAFAIAAPPTQARGALPGGYNAVAGFNALGCGGGGSDDDSDAASSSDGESSDWAAGARRSASNGSSNASGTNADARSSSGSSSTGSASDDGAPPEDTTGAVRQSPKAAARAKRRAAKAREAEEVAQRNLVVGNPEASSGAWGYPFTGPRSRTLFISRRSRRHRLMRWHLAAALAASQAEAGASAAGGAAASAGGLTLAAAGSTDDTGPVFSAGSGFRLDKRTFWQSLLPSSGATSEWQELTGPNDPLVLSGCYAVSSQGGAELLVTLRAYNRLALDVEGVEVAVRLVGPVRLERREVSWMLPRLLPTEAATHQFKVLATGYARVELHARVILPVGGEASVPALRCRPLAISMARMLRVPRGLVAGPTGFLESWAALPVSAELPIVTTWPGVDGLLLALSALARQPLRCAWRRALPAVCGAQAAYLTAPVSSASDVLALVVTLQLMPPPQWDAASKPGAKRAGGQQHSGGDDSQDVGGDEPSGGGGSGMHSGDSTGETPVEAARRLCGDMVAVGHMAVRSSSHELVLAVRDHAAEWVEDLAQGTLALGLAPPHMAASDKPLLHPTIACLARCYEAAPFAVPLPGQVPEPEMPPPPKFTNKCALRLPLACANSTMHACAIAKPSGHFDCPP